MGQHRRSRGINPSCLDTVRGYPHESMWKESKPQRRPGDEICANLRAPVSPPLEAFEMARRSVARFVNAASQDEIVFTSGATEGQQNMHEAHSEYFSWPMASNELRNNLALNFGSWSIGPTSLAFLPHT
eukprot:2191493-Amphidinium_carterae.1